MKKANSFLISNVISSTRLHTSSLSSFSFHCQESSADSLSPSHCDHKETNADFFSSPHQESSASFDADPTNLDPPNSSSERKKGLKWAAFNDLSMKQFESRVECMVLALQGESAKVFSLVVNSKEC